ncbi:MAG: amidohydrolase family protein, partial [Candidatus Nanopelagicales bacterium]
MIELNVGEWRPKSQLRVSTTHVARPSFPVVDSHNHLGRWLMDDDSWLVPDVPALVELMDRVGVSTIVNLDGRWGDELGANVERYDRAYPSRFATFCHVDWSALAEDDDDKAVVERLTTQLSASAALGARGVKIWKDLGLTIRDASGSLVMPNDVRVIEVVAAAGELGLPVLIHTADPVAFFEPLDETNERIDELAEYPHWWFGGPEHPTFDELIGALDGLIAACPGTTFVGAHVGCWAENLDGVAAMLTHRPNWNVDLGGRLAEVGRQPRAFARFVANFPDRVLFGTDELPPSATTYERYFRFLETDDEGFPYSDADIPPQGRWAIYGCALEPQLLQAVYADNARRLF